MGPPLRHAVELVQNVAAKVPLPDIYRVRRTYPEYFMNNLG
jgi:hypothetical protein